MPSATQTHAFENALGALAALAHASRLRIFRALVAAGPQGMSAGSIAEQLGILPTSLSFHLKHLAHSGLVQSRTESRYVIYSTDYQSINALIDYLTENCCNGQACLPTQKKIASKSIRKKS